MKRVRRVEDVRLQSVVDRLAADLAPAMENSHFPYSFTFFDDRAGSVLIPMSLWTRAANEGELAAILAHAMIHIAERNGTRQATRGLTANLSTVPLIFTGSWTSNAGGYNPNFLVNYVRNLLDPGDKPFSPIPPRATRLEALAKEIAALTP